VLGVIPINARYAWRNSRCAWFSEGWLCRVWYYSGVVGACGWRVSDGDRDAEHAAVADRFAHEIGGILAGFPSARGG
jgi:hypothetical protein